MSFSVPLLSLLFFAMRFYCICKPWDETKLRPSFVTVQKAQTVPCSCTGQHNVLLWCPCNFVSATNKTIQGIQNSLMTCHPPSFSSFVFSSLLSDCRQTLLNFRICYMLLLTIGRKKTVSNSIPILKIHPCLWRPSALPWPNSNRTLHLSTTQLSMAEATVPGTHTHTQIHIHAQCLAHLHLHLLRAKYLL